MCLFSANRLYKNTYDYAFVLLSIMILSFTFLNLQKKSIENYENITTKSTNNSIPTNLTTSTDIIKNFTTEEDPTVIQDQLVVYLSSYSNTSYNNTNIWNNISINKNNKNSDFIFANKPIYTSTKELKLQSNNISGPLSMDIGINMSKDFSLFINTKISAFTEAQTHLNMFEMYATVNTNGLYMHLIKENNKYYIKIRCPFINIVMYEINIDNFTVFDNNFHLYTIVKNSEFLKLYIDTKLVLTTEIIYFDNKFSNKEVNIMNNKDNNILVHFTHFGIYNKELTNKKDVNEISVLYNYINDLMLKQTEAYNALLNDFTKMKATIAISKENPFNNSDIKEKCSMIKDWNNFDQIVLNADEACLKAINTYCRTDKNFPQCKVFNSFQKLVPYFTENKVLEDSRLLDVNLDKNINEVSTTSTTSTTTIPEKSRTQVYNTNKNLDNSTSTLSNDSLSLDQMYKNNTIQSKKIATLINSPVLTVNPIVSTVPVVPVTPIVTTNSIVSTNNKTIEKFTSDNRTYKDNLKYNKIFDLYHSL